MALIPPAAIVYPPGPVCGLMTGEGVHILRFADWLVCFRVDPGECFCPSCFLRFLPLTQEEVSHIESVGCLSVSPEQIDSIDLESVHAEHVYFLSIPDRGSKSFLKSSARHPTCISHSTSFFLIEEFGNNSPHLLEYYRGLLKKRENESEISIATNLIEKDTDICSYGAPVRALFSSPDSSNVLSHNPGAYVYSRSNLLYTCSGFDQSPNIALRKAIIEGIERFSEFSPTIFRNVELSYHELQKQKRPERIFPLKNSVPVFSTAYQPWGEDTSVEWVYAYHITSDSLGLIPKEHVFLSPHKNKVASLHSLTSIGGAAHFDPKQAIYGSILELIERDALMKLWLYQYIPEEYTLSSIQQQQVDELTQAYIPTGYLLRLLKVQASSCFVTIALLTATDTSVLPYYFMGSGADMDEFMSIQKSLHELIGNLKNKELFSYRDITANEVRDSADHYVYYASFERFGELTFLIESGAQVAIINNPMPQKEFDITEFIRKIDIEVYIVDITPRFLRDKGIYVMKAVSPELQEMTFGIRTLRLHYTIDTSRVKSDLKNTPHPFS